ncbi:MerR family transcriptional regulator [Variovorax paradoxus]|jgi:chaperone modulatory protein CbpM|uniref:chaperone modulator CbpM n=1 Tax=Variovorax paradoxus TaxID=34073 RepID=UPI0027D7A47E|nr:chaperone modulator CbpM [Variovorax paradoxus]
MATVSVTTTAISASQPLAASELAHACGADTEWVVQLVEVGIVQIAAAEAPPEHWRFSSTDLQCALEARRLERDFGVGLDAAALILDLQHEVRRLKAVIRAHGLR